jgi:hypothetical protein
MAASPAGHLLVTRCPTKGEVKTAHGLIKHQHKEIYGDWKVTVRVVQTLDSLEKAVMRKTRVPNRSTGVHEGN